jgi:hypothetical protein
MANPIAALQHSLGTDSTWLAYLVAALVAALVGVADILTRYKENPLVALWTGAALAYVLANAFFGALALWLAFVLNVVSLPAGQAGPGATPIDHIRSGLIAGFGAIFILRGVAFKLAVGGNSSDVGPSTIVDSLLATFDQSIDRTVAMQKDRAIRALMAEVSFEKAKAFVPVYCLSLVAQDEQLATRVGQLVNAIAEFKKLDVAADAERSFLLGNVLINAFGYQVTSNVIKGFKDRLK